MRVCSMQLHDTYIKTGKGIALVKVALYHTCSEEVNGLQ